MARCSGALISVLPQAPIRILTPPSRGRDERDESEELGLVPICTWCDGTLPWISHEDVERAIVNKARVRSLGQAGRSRRPPTFELCSGDSNEGLTTQEISGSICGAKTPAEWSTTSPVDTRIPAATAGEREHAASLEKDDALRPLARRSGAIRIFSDIIDTLSTHSGRLSALAQRWKGVRDVDAHCQSPSADCVHDTREFAQINWTSAAIDCPAGRGIVKPLRPTMAYPQSPSSTASSRLWSTIIIPRIERPTLILARSWSYPHPAVGRMCTNVDTGSNERDRQQLGLFRTATTPDRLLPWNQSTKSEPVVGALQRGLDQD